MQWFACSTYLQCSKAPHEVTKCTCFSGKNFHEANLLHDTGCSIIVQFNAVLLSTVQYCRVKKAHYRRIEGKHSAIEYSTKVQHCLVKEKAKCAGGTMVQ